VADFEPGPAGIGFQRRASGLDVSLGFVESCGCLPRCRGSPTVDMVMFRRHHRYGRGGMPIGDDD